MSQATGFKLARLILDFCEVLAWPAVVLICVGTFRMEIRSLLERLRHLKAFGAESSFDAGLTTLSPQQQAEKEKVDTAEARAGQMQGGGSETESAATGAGAVEQRKDVYRRILAQLEREFGVAPRLDIVWKGRPDMVFDAFFEKPDATFVEIKLSSVAATVDSAALQLREKLRELEKDIGVNARGLVVVATNAKNLPQFSERARLAKQRHKGVDVRIYDVDLLSP